MEKNLTPPVKLEEEKKLLANSLSSKVGRQMDDIIKVLGGDFNDPSEIEAKIETLKDLVRMVEEIPEYLEAEWIESSAELLKLWEDKLGFKYNVWSEDEKAGYDLAKLRNDFTFLGKVALNYGLINLENYE